MMVVVAYDVQTLQQSGRKRLSRVSKMCCHYGQRVQNSVFECLVSPSEFLVLENELEKIIDKDEDSLRFYMLGDNYSSRIKAVGKRREMPTDDVMIV